MQQTTASTAAGTPKSIPGTALGAASIITRLPVSSAEQQTKLNQVQQAMSPVLQLEHPSGIQLAQPMKLATNHLTSKGG
jgi:hypothetical protein